MAITRGGRGSSTRASSEGNPAKFMEMASSLLNIRTRQGSGKKVKDRASYGTAGNPREFMEMASELRRATQQQGQ
ncbi:hypothetical protein [Thermostichus vulcanus]|uniref:Uncharacterized protein n=1 Tax=Thermostichus vulcanus str. 'Rupite' TaxID=2813851 RepID=A0ABT0CEU3_THEVL|nr:hypothetical protein [Thermostichus vulcanus]MCJ2544301.1 hypothetical protein [Thermostichus vulcanus str. 'Rupite']